MKKLSVYQRSVSARLVREAREATTVQELEGVYERATQDFSEDALDAMHAKITDAYAQRKV
jgi:hypothetical protein